MYKAYILVFIFCVFLCFIFLTIPDLLFQLELNETGLPAQATVLATRQRWGTCSVTYRYNIADQAKSFTAYRMVPCTNTLYQNIIVGSFVDIRYLPSRPAASNLVDNRLVWWVDIVRAIAAVIGVVSFIIVMRQGILVGEHITVGRVIVGGLAFVFLSMGLLLAIGGLDVLEIVPVMLICSSILGLILMMGIWIKRKNSERYIKWLEKRWKK